MVNVSLSEQRSGSSFKQMNVTILRMLKVLIVSFILLISGTFILSAKPPIPMLELMSATRSCIGAANTSRLDKITLSCRYYNEPASAVPYMRLGYREAGTSAWIMSTMPPTISSVSAPGMTDLVFPFSPNLQNKVIEVALFSIDTGTPRNIAIKVKTCPMCSGLHVNPSPNLPDPKLVPKKKN